MGEVLKTLPRDGQPLFRAEFALAERPLRRPRRLAFGLAFDSLDASAVHAWIAGRDARSDFAYVVTPNVDHVVRLENAGAELRAAYAGAALCLCDSRTLRRIARLLGIRLTLVPGSDLVASLFEGILERGDRVCLIGGEAGDKSALARLYPAIEVVQHIPPMGLATNAPARRAAAEFAACSGARVVLLAVGSPQQELLAADIARQPQAAGTALCIGASVDFILGTRRRAPRLLRQAGLEWAWRLASEPRRLARRYLVDGPRIFLIALRWWRARRLAE
ncbi:MAG: WecB/TagA/CpsF family glycosyltransferase [Sphingomonadales bacterium]|nr:WecB/TagA/CpsF family glycosyltransferase [Sphingomonadales bacterium]